MKPNMDRFHVNRDRPLPVRDEDGQEPHEPITFTALDKKEYYYDKWYPLPFVVGGLSMVPTLSESHLLFIKTGDGPAIQWTPWTQSGEATHWMVKREGWFEI